MAMRRRNAQQTILLVEDDPPLADLIGEIFADAGYLVEHAARGRTALERLLCNPPDLLLLDLGLPDIDGLEVCRLARRHSPQIPIVILTGRAETRDVVEGFAHGADDYLRKSVDIDVLLARIGALLRALPTRNYTTARAR